MTLLLHRHIRRPYGQWCERGIFLHAGTARYLSLSKGKQRNFTTTASKHGCMQNSFTQQVRMYYRSGTGGRCCIGAGHSPDGSTFLREMTPWPPSWFLKCDVTDVKSKIQLCQSMRNYVKNIPVKFHSDPIWNDGALGVFGDGRPNMKNKISIDMRSVPVLWCTKCAKFMLIPTSAPLSRLGWRILLLISHPPQPTSPLGWAYQVMGALPLDVQARHFSFNQWAMDMQWSVSHEKFSRQKTDYSWKCNTIYVLS